MESFSQPSREEIRRTKDAERKHKAGAEEQEDRKAVDAERRRRARAWEQEDRKAANAERKRKARAEKQVNPTPRGRFESKAARGGERVGQISDERRAEAFQGKDGLPGNDADYQQAECVLQPLLLEERCGDGLSDPARTSDVREPSLLDRVREEGGFPGCGVLA